MDLSKLKEPFPPEKISWRVGPTNGDKTSGIALAYIDARDVMERLDGVCGIAGWQCTYPHANGKTVCAIGIKVEAEWVFKADGAGDTDMEAEKGALSDAFKRAAVRWGVGRYLYDVENIWVKIVPAGKSYKIAESEYPRLRALLEGKKVPVPAAVSSPTDDPDGQLQAWVDQQTRIINSANSLPDLTAWLDKMAVDADGRGDLAKPATGSPLYRLSKKAPEQFAVVKARYMQKLAML